MPDKYTVQNPLYPTQWGLRNTGQQGGHIGADIDVVPVWPDYTGVGVRVGVIDDGVQLDHPGLAPNIDVADSYDAVAKQSGGGAGGPTGAGQNHGTAVAGIIGAANSQTGSIGVAPAATLISFRIPLGNDPLYTGEGSTDFLPTEDQAIENAFNQALTTKVDVASDSWGSDAPFGDNFNSPTPPVYGSALVALATQGRGGLGAVIVFANGNARQVHADGTLNGLTGSRFVVAVAAVDNDGVVSSYSTPGANLLISAPAGASTDQLATIPGNGITTTDRTGPAGYNPQPSPAGDTTFDFNGTSAATPFVSGVVALMLQADPNLGYRDAQQILAYSARLTDPSASGWGTNGASNANGGGLHFNSDYGFGLIDARAAVRLAESYASAGNAAETASNEQSISGTYTAPTPQVVGKVLSKQITLGNDVLLNHLDLTLTMRAPNVQFSVFLYSPSGTTVEMAPAAAMAETIWPGTFTLGTDAFWGEKSGGVWTVALVPAVTAGDFASFLTAATVTGYGGRALGPPTLIYTDGFAASVAAAPAGAPDRTVIRPAAGPVTVNAAAVSGDVTFNLATSTGAIGGQAVTVAAGTTVSAIYSGDGNDHLYGTGQNDVFSAGRGVNTIDGGGGSNTAVLIGARANYQLGLDQAGITVNSRDGATQDTLTHIQSLRFGDTTGDLTAAISGSIIAGNTGAQFGQAYTGPVSGLQWQFLADTQQGLWVSSALPNVFLRGGTGNDALVATGGSNVIDGGGGSNWLVGGDGSDGGRDTFFIDNLLSAAPQTEWDTLIGFHSGDALTLWGFNPATDTYRWTDSSGAAGYTGATIEVDRVGSTAVTLATFTGLTVAGSGFATNAGQIGGLGYLAVGRV